MDGPKTDETVYEFKENTKLQDKQEMMDNIDDFERRLRGDAPRAAKRTPAASAAPGAKAVPQKKGAEYVKQAAARPKKPAKKAADDDDDDDADDVKRMMAELDKFDDGSLSD